MSSSLISRPPPGSSTPPTALHLLILVEDGHRKIWPLRGKRFRAWLRQQYYERTESSCDKRGLSMCWRHRRSSMARSATDRPPRANAAGRPRSRRDRMKWLTKSEARRIAMKEAKARLGFARRRRLPEPVTELKRAHTRRRADDDQGHHCGNDQSAINRPNARGDRIGRVKDGSGRDLRFG